MTTASLIFTPAGTGTGLYTDLIPLSAIGHLTIRRATWIEFDNDTQYWRVKDATDFPLYSSPSRETCLEWERRYLEEEEDRKHELPASADPTAPGA